MPKVSDAEVFRSKFQAPFGMCASILPTSPSRRAGRSDAISSGLFVIFCLALALSGCAQDPSRPTFISSGHDSLLDRDGGVNLMADACIQYDALGDVDDHFIGDDSGIGATQLLATTKQYLLTRNIQVHSAIVPFVCGALHNAGNTPAQFAMKFDQAAEPAQQPFAVREDLKGDTDYVSALSKISTYVFQRALSAKEGANSHNIFSSQTPYIVSPEDFKAAVAVIASKNQGSNLVVLGMTGVRKSRGKSLLQQIGMEALAGAVLGAGQAAAGPSNPVAITQNGNLVYSHPMLIPGPLINEGTSVKQVIAGLVNIKTGELVWVKSIDDKASSSPNAIDLLLFDLVHKSATTWSPPGAPS